MTIGGFPFDTLRTSILEHLEGMLAELPGPVRAEVLDVYAPFFRAQVGRVVLSTPAAALQARAELCKRLRAKSFGFQLPDSTSPYKDTRFWASLFRPGTGTGTDGRRRVMQAGRSRLLAHRALADTARVEIDVSAGKIYLDDHIIMKWHQVKKKLVAIDADDWVHAIPHADVELIAREAE